jgi:hypothetical protein
MPKTVPESKFQEWKGLDRISAIVHEMKCIFREINKDDFGIDGEIEVVEQKPDGSGYQTSGGIIKVQAKSGMSYVKQDTDTSFFSPVKKDDLELWHKATYPTIYIVYHPDDDKLYWKEIKSYVKDTPNVWQPPHKIVFNKATDEFTPICFQTVRSLAPESQTTRISLNEQERLISNLLHIKRIPKVWSAQCTVKHFDQVRFALHGFVPPYNVIAGQIYSLSDLRAENCILRRFCDTSTVRLEQPENWWGDEVLERNYVFMLNQLLGIHLRRCSIRYNRQFKRNYLPRENQTDSEFQTQWYNVRTKRTVPDRTTAKFYTYGNDSFWRHAAAELSFRRMGQTWFMQIIPKYFFTEDGVVPWDSNKVGKYTTQIKALETNQQVLNHVLFWADVLSRAQKDNSNKAEIIVELDTSTVMVIDKMPVTGIAKFAIPFDPATYEEPASSAQISFLDWLDKLDENSDDD